MLKDKGIRAVRKAGHVSKIDPLNRSAWYINVPGEQR